MAHTLVPSDRVQGTPVYGRNDEKFGTIERLMLDKMSGKVVYAVVKSGGLFSAEHHHYPLAWDLLKYNPERERYDTSLSLSELRSGPCELDNTFDYGERRTLADMQPQYWGI